MIVLRLACMITSHNNNYEHRIEETPFLCLHQMNITAIITYFSHNVTNNAFSLIVTGSSGHISFPNLKPGLYVLKVHAYNKNVDAVTVKRGFVITSDPNYCSLVLVNRGVRVGDDGSSAKIEVQLHGPATLLLCVLDGGDAFPCK